MVWEVGGDTEEDEQSWGEPHHAGVGLRASSQWAGHVWGRGLGDWRPAQALTLAVAPAAEGHPSNDKKDSCGCSSYPSHHLHSGQQVCREKKGHAEQKNE